jgi:hypothetical protein
MPGKSRVHQRIAGTVQRPVGFEDGQVVHLTSLVANYSQIVTPVGLIDALHERRFLRDELLDSHQGILHVAEGGDDRFVVVLKQFFIACPGPVVFTAQSPALENRGKDRGCQRIKAAVRQDNVGETKAREASKSGELDTRKHGGLGNLGGSTRLVNAAHGCLEVVAAFDGCFLKQIKLWVRK